MGNKASKRTIPISLSITDYEKLKIPKEYRLLKIASYNINIRNTINLNNKIDRVVRYLTSNTKNKPIDVLCLQGIRDYYSACQLIKSIMSETGNVFYITPKLDITTEIDTDPLINPQYDTSKKNKRRSTNDDSIKMQNIIISRYPIISDIYGEYDNNVKIDEIFGTKTLNGANISVDGNIISVYSTELTRDIKNAKIMNVDKRRHELKVLRYKIRKNIAQLQTNKIFSNYFKTDIHMLLGSFNISEFIDDDLNEEFVTFIKQFHCVDIFRHMNAKDTGTTDNTDKRKDYLMFLLTDDIYQPGTDNNAAFNKIKTSSDLFKFIMKRYKIHCLETSIYVDADTEHTSDRFPIEMVFMMSKNAH